jgi:hypothetical protein
MKLILRAIQDARCQAGRDVEEDAERNSARPDKNRPASFYQTFLSP